MEQFIGKWKLIDSTNLRYFLTALGVEDEVNDVAQVVKPKLIFFQEGDKVGIDLESSVFTQKSYFRLGEEFHLKTWDGRDCKVVMSLDGDKLIEEGKWNDSESTYIYEIKDGQLITTLTTLDAVTVCTFEKLS